MSQLVQSNIIPINYLSYQPSLMLYRNIQLKAIRDVEVFLKQSNTVSDCKQMYNIVSIK